MLIAFYTEGRVITKSSVETDIPVPLDGRTLIRKHLIDIYKTVSLGGVLMKNCKKMIVLFSLAALFMVTALAGGVRAAGVPQNLTYQGYLTDDQGNPIDTYQSGPIQMVFTIYDAVVGGNIKWTQTQDVDVNNGIYSVVLGGGSSPNPVNLPFDQQYYLGIAVGTDAEMIPRQLLTSIGSAIHADTADFAYDIADSVVTDPKISGTINGSKLGSHSHSGNDITSGTVQESRIDAAIARAADVTASISVHTADTSAHHSRYTDTEALNAVQTAAYITALQNSVTDLQNRIASLENLLVHFSRSGNEVYIQGANLHIRNGNSSGLTQTDNVASPGTGNLIIGYNEPRNDGTDNKTGWHNLIIGKQNNYSSYGGIVSGLHNTTSFPYASVTGGAQNTAAASYASVTGGYNNTAADTYASVSGGSGNRASASYASVSGGYQNEAGLSTGQYASVTGGSFNRASFIYASVNGGNSNEASAAFSSVSGGYDNTANGTYSSVSGGELNTANGEKSSISGGYNNVTSVESTSSSISGGYNVLTSGFFYGDWAAGGLYEQGF